MQTNLGPFYWEEATGAIYNLSVTYPVRVTLAKYDGEVEHDDELALKSENEKLKAKIAALEAIVAALQPKYPWADFYQGFTQRIEYVDKSRIIYNVFFGYVDTALFISFDTRTFTEGEYFIVIDLVATTTYYIRCNVNNKTAYLRNIS